jgi:aspartate racemase
MRHIGILAHSAEGATLCYREAWLEGIRRLGAHQHPEITLTGVAMHVSLDDWERGNLAPIRRTFASGAAKLRAAGADFFVCPDNTAHIALELPGEPLALPCLHIAEVVARRAVQDGRGRVGILGTKWTMEGPVYPAAFARHGLAWDIPEAGERAIVQRIIFEELCLGIFRDEALQEYVRIIRHLAEKGCDAVALVCTEIPLLIDEASSPLPILDSTRLLARAAVATALGDVPIPAWRGGPYG